MPPVIGRVPNADAVTTTPTGKRGAKPIVTTTTYAKDMDNQLHRERTDTSEHLLPFSALPDGVFVDTEDGPAVVVGDHFGGMG